MSYRKTKIVTIMTLMILVLLMMSTTIQAATIGKVYGLTSNFDGKSVVLKWDSVSGASGYDVFADNKYIGYVNDNQAALINYSENTTYYIKVQAYIYQNGNKVHGEASSEIRVSTATQKSLGKVNNLEISQNNGLVSLNWSKVDNATKYQILADIPNFGTTIIGEVPTTGAIISNCQNGKNYTFKIRACRNLSSETVGYGDYSNSKSITINSNISNDDYNNVKPDRVTNVNISNVTETSAYITWDYAKNADGYDVLLSKNYSNSYTTIKSTSNRNVTLSNLDDNTYYKVKIQAYKYVNGSKKYGDESYYESFTTKEEKPNLSQVRNLDVSNVTENSAYLDWSSVSNADGYEIYLSTNNGGYSYYSQTSNIYKTITGLNSDTYYKVKVKAYKYVNGSKKYGDESYYESFTTKEEKPNLSQVRNLDVSNVTENSAYLDWSSVSNADGYNIYISKNNESFKFYGATIKTNHTITNLNINTDYKVRVEAYKIINREEITGEYSNTKYFTTLNRSSSNTTNLGKVTHFTTSVENRNEAYLNWWAVSGAEGYDVYISDNNGRNYTLIADTLNTNIILYDLEYSTNYKVKVRAYIYKNDEKVYSNLYSEVNNFTTEKYNKTQDNPSISRVQNVRPSVTGSVLYLSWNIVSGADGYEIYFTVPGIGGGVRITTTDNYRTISGLTDKKYNYTARVRAYKTINGIRNYGEYSYITEFKGK